MTQETRGFVGDKGLRLTSQGLRTKTPMQTGDSQKTRPQRLCFPCGASQPASKRCCSQSSLPVRALKAHPFLSAFHSPCQRTDSQSLGPKTTGQDSRSFQKMLSWLLAQRMIHWEQNLVEKGRSRSFTSFKSQQLESREFLQPVPLQQG